MRSRALLRIKAAEQSMAFENYTGDLGIISTMKPWKVADDAVGRHRCYSTPSMSHSRNKVYPKIRYKCPLWLSNIHKVILFRGTAIPDNLCFNKLCTNNFFKTQRIPFVY